MENRGLLTDDDRAFFQGETDKDDPDAAWSTKRHNVRERARNMAEDLDILREAGEDDLVEFVYEEIGRYEQLDRRLKELEEQLDDG